MYLTASVKFLQAIGITDFAVYGVQTDGPITVIPAAILRGKDNVHSNTRPYQDILLIASTVHLPI